MNKVSASYDFIEYNAVIKKILMNFKQNKIDEVEFGVRMLFEQAAKKRFDLDFLNQILTQLIAIAIEEMKEMQMDLKELMGEKYVDDYYNINNILKNFKTLDESEKFVISILECFMIAILGRKYANNNKFEKLDNIVKYINNNYSEKNLSLEYISEKFHYNPYYLSVLFKKATGQTFTEYLIELRMGAAKFLLKNTNYSAKHISTLVGYTTYHGFMKIFKKREKVSPAHFRNEKFKLQ